MAIDIALVGYGHWGKILKRYLDLSNRFRLKYVCFRSAKEEGIFTSNIRRILEDDSIKVVVVATPIKTHYEIIRSAIMAKKNVMCEKPLVTTQNQALIIRQMAEANNIKVVTDFTYAFSPSIKQVKKALQQDMIGNIDYLEMRMLQYGRFSGENAFDVLASHCLAILYEWNLIDDMLFEFKPLITKNDIIETGEVILKKGDFKGKILVSLNSPIRERTIYVFGDRGFISFNPLKKATLQVFSNVNCPDESAVWTDVKNYEFDERNNLINALDYLYQVLEGSEKDNLDMAIRVATVLGASSSSSSAFPKQV